MKHRCCRTDESGAAAVEFAIIASIFIVIMMGIIEFGLIIYSYNSAQNAARDVTRRLSTNLITAENAPAAAMAELPSWIRSNSSVKVTVTQTTPSTPSTNIFTLTISFPATIASPTDFLSWAYKNVTIKAKVSMQEEPTS